MASADHSVVVVSSVEQVLLVSLERAQVVLVVLVPERLVAAVDLEPLAAAVEQPETGLAGGGAGNIGGFFGLLQTLQQYRNARDSLDLQIRTLALLEGNLEGGVVDVVEVDQFRQTIETQRAQLLQSRNGLQASIENYLTGTLGLPPDLEVELDDDFIKRFQLIDPVMTDFQNEIYNIQNEVGGLEEAPSKATLVDLILQVKKNREELIEYFDEVREGVNNVDQAIESRRDAMDPKDLKRLIADAKSWKAQLDPISKKLEETITEIQSIEDNLTDENTQESTTAFVVWMRKYLGMTQEIVLLQARSRLQNVYLDKPIRLDLDCALKIAYNNRLDYRNARASLVDTWRLIEFNANRLKSDLSITAAGDIRTNKNNIANFRDHAGSAQLGVQFDAPFTRLLERNNFRGALIEYQAARRSFVRATDGINSTMRNLLRSLNELELNLEIQRRAVDIAIRRVEVTEEKLQEPPNPDDPSRFGPTDVQNLSSALADLRNSQNNLMSVWLNYYSTRMLLIRDLGIMELDERDRWIDMPIDESLCFDQDMLADVPPNVPQEWVEEVFEDGTIPENSDETNAEFNYFDASNAGPAEANYLESKPEIETRQQIQKRLSLQQRMMSSDQSTLEEAKKLIPASEHRFINFERRQVSSPPNPAPAPSNEVEFAEVRKVDPQVADKQMSTETKSKGNLRWAHMLKSPTQNR